MISLDMQSRIPIYEQLVSKFAKLFMLGFMKSGEQLPTVRNLATSLSINPNTVQKAYRTLELQGLIYSIEGKGSFVSELATSSSVKTALATKELESALHESIMWGLNKDQVLTTVEKIYTVRSDIDD